MAFVKTRALVIRKIDFSETSQVLRFLTADHGKITGIAKGSKRKKTGFSGPFDYLTLYEIVYIDKRASSMDILTASEALDRFPNIVRDFSRYGMASYVAEFLDTLVADGQQIKGLFDGTVQALQHLNTSGEPGLGLMHFEGQALRLLGYMPRTETCCLCSAPLGHLESVHFSARHGGALCPRCPGTDPTRVIVRTPALRLLQGMSQATPGDFQAMAVSESDRGELRRILNYFIVHLMEREPRTLSFIARQV